MIIYPINWNEVGRPVRIRDLEIAVSKILSELSCDCLSFSGGLDSSLMLYFMLQRYRHVRTFTIGISEDHPDVRYAQLVADSFTNVAHNYYIPSQKEIKDEEQPGDLEGDEAVRLFYKFVKKHTNEIIACDGVDEYMAGYYGHQNHPNEETYYGYIRQLQKRQLIPLNRNSGQIKVYLPFLDNRLLQLLSQIPLSEKIDENSRKKLMVEMAKGKIPDEIIHRRKYGFCDALKIKKAITCK